MHPFEEQSLRRRMAGWSSQVIDAEIKRRNAEARPLPVHTAAAPTPEQAEAMAEIRRLRGMAGPAPLPPPTRYSASRTGQRFEELVRAYRDKGLRKGEAIRHAVHEHPEAHDDYLMRLQEGKADAL